MCCATAFQQYEHVQLLIYQVSFNVLAGMQRIFSNPSRLSNERPNLSPQTWFGVCQEFGLLLRRLVQWGWHRTFLQFPDRLSRSELLGYRCMNSSNGQCDENGSHRWQATGIISVMLNPEDGRRGITLTLKAPALSQLIALCHSGTSTEPGKDSMRACTV